MRWWSPRTLTGARQNTSLPINSAYWLHRTSVREISLSRTLSLSSTACKRRKGRVQSEVVNLFACSRIDSLTSEGEAFSVDRILPRLLRLRRCCLDILRACYFSWTKPLSTSLLLAALRDLGRSKSQLKAENALLPRQLIIVGRQVKRPAYRKADRLLLVLLARLVRT
jgi:hypothetical protein